MSWKPIGEAPKDGRFVLLHGGGYCWENPVVAYWNEKSGRWLDEDLKYRLDPPTHYMEIPEL